MVKRSEATGYPDELLDWGEDDNEEFWDFFSSDLLMEFRDGFNQDPNPKLTIIEDPEKRYKTVKEFADKHKAQIYTLVDGDDGEIYMSKGIRFCNRINMGLYAVVKVDGWEVDNS